MRRPIYIVGYLTLALLAFLGSLLLTHQSTALPTSVAYADSPDLAVYSDQLNAPFVSWSWGSMINLQDTTYVNSGTKAIAFTPSAWGALYLHTDNAISPVTYDSLQFSLYRTNTNQTFSISLYDENNQQIIPFTPLTNFTTLGNVGIYKTYTLPFSLINPSNKLIKGIAIQETSGQNQPTIYIDDILLKGKPLPTPTPTSIPTPTPQPTSPSPTIGATPSAGTSAYPVFMDGLATGVSNWSWGSTITNVTNPVYAGTQSLSFTVNQGWAGLFLHLANALDPTAYSSVSFALYGSTPGQTYSLVLRDDTNTPIGTPLSLSTIGGDVPSGSWKTYTVPLTTLDSGNKKISGIVLQDTTGHSQPALYIDNIQFLAAQSSPSIQTQVASNPFSGISLYTDPNTNAKTTADSWRAAGRSADADQLMKIANNPIALWAATADPFAQINTYLTKSSATNSMGVLVAYNLPGRDCGLYSQGGSTYNGYKSWIDTLSSTIGTRKTAVILEPDALGLDCLQNANTYSLLRYAVDTLSAKSNIAVYVDASSWIDATTMSQRLQNIDISRAQGFALNTSGFNTTNDMTQYGQTLSSKLNGKHFVVDTSRNGNGPYDPTQYEPWCNPPGRALGIRPTNSTGINNLDAYLWVKYPGESDGTCRGGPNAGTWWPDYALGLAQQAGF